MCGCMLLLLAVPIPQPGVSATAGTWSNLGIDTDIGLYILVATLGLTFAWNCVPLVASMVMWVMAVRERFSAAKAKLQDVSGSLLWRC